MTRNWDSEQVATSATKGVTHRTSRNACPSYLDLFIPSDRALVEKAHTNIEKHRMSNIAITVAQQVLSSGPENVGESALVRR